VSELQAITIRGLEVLAKERPDVVFLDYMMDVVEELVGRNARPDA
jgi:hypothetical protein